MDSAKSKIALDIGANRGDYINLMFGHGFTKIYAFEPVPVFFDQLQKCHGKDPRVQCVNLGLSNKPGTVKDVTVLSACTIGRPEQTQTLSVCPSFAGKPFFDMKTTTLDLFFKDNLDPIGFIKLDVDGYEYRVMKGGEAFLRKFMPPMLCELGAYVAEIGDNIKEWIEFVFSLGYCIMPMDGKYVFTTWDQIEPWYPMHTTFDVLFVPSIPKDSTPAPRGIKINKSPWHTT